MKIRSGKVDPIKRQSLDMTARMFAEEDHSGELGLIKTSRLEYLSTLPWKERKGKRKGRKELEKLQQLQQYKETMSPFRSRKMAPFEKK